MTVGFIPGSGRLGSVCPKTLICRTFIPLAVSLPERPEITSVSDPDTPKRLPLFSGIILGHIVIGGKEGIVVFRKMS